MTWMLYVELNICPSCGRRYDRKDLVLARKPVMAKYVPKSGSAELSANSAARQGAR